MADYERPARVTPTGRGAPGRGGCAIMAGVNLAELLLEAVEGRHVGVLDRRKATGALAGRVGRLRLLARRSTRGRR